VDSQKRVTIIDGCFECGWFRSTGVDIKGQDGLCYHPKNSIKVENKNTCNNGNCPLEILPENIIKLAEILRKTSVKKEDIRNLKEWRKVERIGGKNR